MKVILILGLSCILACHARSGRESTLSTLPSFNMLLMDSTTVLKAEQISPGRPIILIFFEPDCPHCQEETQALTAHMEALKNVRIYMVTLAPLKEIKDFYHKNHLAKYGTFIVGQDYKYSFFRTFRPTQVPYMAIYDTNKQLVKIFYGELSVEKILNAIQV